MPIIVKENVSVTDIETIIIEPTETDKEKDRIFTITNGENKIEVKALGTNDGETWIEKAFIEIEANDNGTLIVGLNVYIVKLIGRTLILGRTSIVDASLTW